MKIKFDPRNLLILLLTLTCLGLAVAMLRTPHTDSPAPKAAAENKTLWTCSMHPQIQNLGPGQCPICGMDLIRMPDETPTNGDWEITLTEHARKLAEIQTARVERRTAPRLVEMVGRITYDEKRIGVISARVPGRIDRLFVDYTGIEVREGDHMVELYSPELVSAREELKQARRGVTEGHLATRATAQRRLEATREKLRLLGFSDDQIQRIEMGGDTSPHLTILSPTSGIVTQKHLKEGAYVKTGTPIYTVVDLSRVWVQLEAYESDLAWLRFGQEVTFDVEAFPGETFKGRIVFIDQVLNPKTRTVTVRMDIPNPEGRLKPDMFVRARVASLIGPGGKVMDPVLAGKWISPMHPEIVKDGPGSCDVCGMDLVPAEKLGFTAELPESAPLLIPATAPLLTGESAVVYVAKEPGRYVGRRVVLGPKAGDWYMVRSGLEEGEEVVIHGAFKIDSELQIRTGRGMMYPASQASEPHQGAEDAASQPKAQRHGAEHMGALWNHYFHAATALSDDEPEAAGKAMAALAEAVAGIKADHFDAEGRDAWKQHADHLRKALADSGPQTPMATLRTRFRRVSTGMDDLFQTFGAPKDAAVYRFHCPMAFDEGADWLQNHRDTANPYYGSMMYSCGSLSATLAQPEQGGDHD